MLLVDGVVKQTPLPHERPSEDVSPEVAAPAAAPEPHLEPRSDADRGATTARLLDELHRRPTSSRAALRAEVASLNMGVARAIAHRYRDAASPRTT